MRAVKKGGISTVRPSDVYSPLNAAAMFMVQMRHRVLRRILARRFPDGVGSARLLEIGCGGGQWLTEFVSLGFHPSNLAGIEIDAVRLDAARGRVAAGSDLRVGDAGALPWGDGSFDMVFQSTVFTSILDDAKKAEVAKEMLRVCKPGGVIGWYDFAFDNPKNPDVKGVGKAEVERLFSPARCVFWRVTLAPPLMRRIVPLSWVAAGMVDTLCPFLRTHLMAEISR